MIKQAFLLFVLAAKWPKHWRPSSSRIRHLSSFRVGINDGPSICILRDIDSAGLACLREVLVWAGTIVNVGDNGGALGPLL